jgi:hypothetical protein
MLKTDLEPSTMARERDEALARRAAVTTRGDARSYIDYVMAKAHAAETARLSPSELPTPRPRANREGSAVTAASGVSHADRDASRVNL